jgi:hypothetical protein
MRIVDMNMKLLHACLFLAPHRRPAGGERSNPVTASDYLAARFTFENCTDNSCESVAVAHNVDNLHLLRSLF